MRPYENAIFPTSRKRVHMTLDLIAADPSGVLEEATYRGNAAVVSLCLGHLLTHPADAPVPTPVPAAEKPKTTSSPKVEVAVGLQDAHDGMVAANESARIKDAAKAMFKDVLAAAKGTNKGHSIARPAYGEMLRADTLDQAQEIAKKAVARAKRAKKVNA